MFKLCYKSLQDYLTNATIKRTVANTVLKEDHMIKCQMDYLSVVHCEEILHEVEIVVKS